jgi:hypothetical protein
VTTRLPLTNLEVLIAIVLPTRLEDTLTETLYFPLAVFTALTLLVDAAVVGAP